MMKRRQDGFSLVELMVALVVFVFVIAAASGIFISFVNQFKQQSKIAETNIEGIIGLNLLRIDLEHAGYGLPWYFSGGIAYGEATLAPASNYNDAPGNAPRAVLSGNNIVTAGIVSGSDYLVIKSAAVARGETSRRWSYIFSGSEPAPRRWDTTDRLAGGERVIVINPKAGETKLRQLVMSGSSFYTTYNATNFSTSFSPATAGGAMHVIYGIDAATNLKMPFNRADYYVGIPPAGEMPRRCALGTGVLFRAVMSHLPGTDFAAEDITPILDCVADMQVVYRLDTNNDGVPDNATDDISVFAPDALAIRDQLVEVRVYILAHEGQRDPTYTFSAFTPGPCATCITVGEGGLGRNFDLSIIGDANWQNYRWKLYTIVVKPENLR